MELARLAQLPFFQGMPQWALVGLAEAAAEEEVPAGGIVVRQSDRARVVHFLLAGSVQILLRVGEEDLLVAVLRRPGELLGWSAFRAPYRYTASVRCEERAAWCGCRPRCSRSCSRAIRDSPTRSCSVWRQAWPTASSMPASACASRPAGP